jgi:nucleoid DNA-binding protein
MDGILHAVEKGDSVKLVGFMNITLKHYGERKSRNPRTGAISTAAPSVKAFAKLGAAFKDATKKVKPNVAKAKKKA